MFNVNIPECVIKRSREFTERHDMGKRRSGGNGSFEQQFTGNCAENMMRVLFKRRLKNESDTHGSDRGVDINYFGIRIDVKSTNANYRESLHCVNHVDVEQATVNKTDVYLFTALDRRNWILRVRGWIALPEFYIHRMLIPAGGTWVHPSGKSITYERDTYLVRNDRLRSPESIQQLFTQMDVLLLQPLNQTQ